MGRGDYKLTGSEITITIVIRKDLENKPSFTLKGKMDDLQQLATDIVNKSIEIINKKN